MDDVFAYLFAKQWADEEVRKAIHAVRRSRHSGRVQAYSQAQGLATAHEMAVIVQRLAGDFLWTNSNFCEAICDVMTPATWSMWEIHTEAVPFQIPGCPLVGVIGGRPYINLSLLLSFGRTLGIDERTMRKRFEEQHPRRALSVRRRIECVVASARLREDARSEATRVIWVIREFALRVGLPLYPAILVGRFDPFAWAKATAAVRIIGVVRISAPILEEPMRTL